MKFWRSFPVAVPAWLAATALGIVAAWFGLRPVLDAAVPDRAAPLSAAEVRDLALPSAVAVPAPNPSSGTWPAGSASPSVSGTPAGPRSPSASARHPSAGAGAGSSTAPPAVVDGWTVTTQADGTTSYLRSFQVRGGSTVIRMVPGRVSLVSATPNADHSVQTSQNEPTRLVVQFTATQRYDIVDAMWWNDHPYAQVSRVG
ncbi:MAG: hypothetical protein JXA67_14805 [Micromonosporaceae bacterium]|nr:hypothetical protein [Micromonosporaceae bacterium]